VGHKKIAKKGSVYFFPFWQKIILSWAKKKIFGGVDDQINT